MFVTYLIWSDLTWYWKTRYNVIWCDIKWYTFYVANESSRETCLREKWLEDETNSKKNRATIATSCQVRTEKSANCNTTFTLCILAKCEGVKRVHTWRIRQCLFHETNHLSHPLSIGHFCHQPRLGTVWTAKCTLMVGRLRWVSHVCSLPGDFTFEAADSAGRMSTIPMQGN